MYTIRYHADPERCINSHKGNYYDCTEYSERTFPNFHSAEKFLNECTRPLTTYLELCGQEPSRKQHFFSKMGRTFEQSLSNN